MFGSFFLLCARSHTFWKYVSVVTIVRWPCNEQENRDTETPVSLSLFVKRKKFRFQFQFRMTECVCIALVPIALVPCCCCCCCFFRSCLGKCIVHRDAVTSTHHNLTARSDWTGFYLILLNFHASRLRSPTLARSRFRSLVSVRSPEHDKHRIFFRHTNTRHRQIGLFVCLHERTALCMLEQIISMCVSNYRGEFQRQVCFFPVFFFFAFYFLYSISVYSTLIRCI